MSPCPRSELVEAVLLRSEAVTIHLREHVRTIARFARRAGLVCTFTGTEGGARLEVSGPLALLLVQSGNVKMAYVFNFIYQLFSPFWIGSAVALANELVVPRMRATVTGSLRS